MDGFCVFREGFEVVKFELIWIKWGSMIDKGRNKLGMLEEYQEDQWV